MLFLFPAKNRNAGYNRSAPIDNTTSVNGAQVDQPQSISCNVEPNEVSDESPNIYPTPHQQHASLFANDFSAVKKRLRSNDSQTKVPSKCCCWCCQHISPQQKIDNNHKSFISSAEQDYLPPTPQQQQQQCVHHLNVIGEQKQSKRKNRQPSPTHFHRIECTLNVKKSNENLSTVPTSSSSCHSPSRDLITVDHRFNGDAIHSHTNQSLWIDVNCTKSNEIQVNAASVNDCERCCCLCYCSDCRTKRYCLSAIPQCDEPQKASANPLRSSDISARINNNCYFAKNQNNEPSSFCQCDTKDILDIAARKCLLRENFIAKVQNKNLKSQTKQQPKRNVKNKQNVKLINNNNIHSRQTHALRNDDCSDCINCLDKQFIKQIKRFQSTTTTTTDFAPVCIESVPFLRKEQQKKLVCCTQNVTAVRNTATVFMVGDDRSNFVGLKLNQHDKSELVRNGVVFTYQNTALNNHSSNNNNHNNNDGNGDDDDEFNNKFADLKAAPAASKNIDQTCESHKSIGGVSSTANHRKLTSILSAKESHSKVCDHNQVKSVVEVGIEHPPETINTTNQCLNFIDDDDNHERTETVESVQNNDRSTKSDNAGDENNSEIAQYLCHLEKLNLADATAATTVVSGPNEQINRNITHISLTQQRDNNGATTTQTRTATAARATSTTLENERRSAIDEKSKQSQHKNVNIIAESTEQSATPRFKDHDCPRELSELGEQTVDVNNCDQTNEHEKCNGEQLTGKNQKKTNDSDKKLFFDENTVLSENGVNNLNDECIVFEYKPILPPTTTTSIPSLPSSILVSSSCASNCNHFLNRRTSVDSIIDSKSRNCVNHLHRRTNSVGDEPNTTLTKRQSKHSRSFVESISDRFRFVQNTDYRYAYLMPNFVSFYFMMKF